MTDKDLENLDYEKLRKVMTRNSFFAGMFSQSPGMTKRTVEVEAATPEELLNLARRRGIHLEKFIKKEAKK